MTDSRQRFEAWYAKHFCVSVETASRMMAWDLVTLWEAWQAAEAAAVRRCAEIADSYLDRHAKAMVHFAGRDQNAYDYHADRMVTGADIAAAIRAEFPEAWK